MKFIINLLALLFIIVASGYYLWDIIRAFWGHKRHTDIHPRGPYHYESLAKIKSFFLILGFIFMLIAALNLLKGVLFEGKLFF